MKVLYLTSWYPTKNTPIDGTFVREHAKAASMHDEIRVVHCRPDPALSRKLWHFEREEDLALTWGFPTYRYRFYPIPVRGLTMPAYVAGGAWLLQRLIRDGFRPDVIHAHVYDAGYLGAWLGWLYHAPVVITEHSAVFPRKQLPRNEIRKARTAFTMAKQVMPVCKALQKAIEDYGIKANFRVVPNAVDTSLFHPAASRATNRGPIHLLFAALLRSDQRKGLPDLLRAMALIRGQSDECRLDVVGGGPGQAACEELAVELQLSDCVAFHGVRPKAELAELMSQADFFVLPSKEDNLPCVLVEAMASGLPILSTLVGGIPEIVTGEELGILVPPDDGEALASGLMRMMERLAAYDRRAITRAAQKYSYKSVGATLHEIYSACLSK